MKSHFLFPFVLLFLFSCSKKVVDNGPMTYRIVDKTETTPKPAPKKEETKNIKNKEAFFIITGINGLWSVEISEKEIRYISKTAGQSFSVPYTDPILSADNGKLYQSKTKANNIEVTIYNGKCSETVTKMPNSHIVKVAIKKNSDKEFNILKGCGNYMLDEQISGNWTLLKIKGKLVIPTDFGVDYPSIDFQTSDAQFTGFAGCNRMKGSLELTESNHVKFDDIVTTRMSCMPENKEPAFLQALRTIKSYDFKDGNLLLSDSNETQLEFIKS